MKGGGGMLLRCDAVQIGRQNVKTWTGIHGGINLEFCCQRDW